MRDGDRGVYWGSPRKNPDDPEMLCVPSSVQDVWRRVGRCDEPDPEIVVVARTTSAAPGLLTKCVVRPGRCPNAVRPLERGPIKEVAMSKQLARYVGAPLLALIAIGLAAFVVRMWKKCTPVQNLVHRMNKAVVNPEQMGNGRKAGRLCVDRQAPRPHVGQRVPNPSTGLRYGGRVRDPAALRRQRGLAQERQAEGSATIVNEGGIFQVDHAELVSSAVAESYTRPEDRRPSASSVSMSICSAAGGGETGDHRVGVIQNGTTGRGSDHDPEMAALEWARTNPTIECCDRLFSSLYETRELVVAVRVRAGGGQKELRSPASSQRSASNVLPASAVQAKSRPAPDPTTTTNPSTGVTHNDCV